MASQYVNLDFLRFLLFEVHHAGDLSKYDRYREYDISTINILIDSVKSFADQDLYPYFKEMDEQPVRFEQGRVLVHPQVEKIIKTGAELGLIASGFDHEIGGLQIPHLVHYALLHILDSANNHVTGYLELTAGAAKLIASFGNDDLVKHFVPPMLEGKWMGTMALTEPQAGSSLSDVATLASPQEDGTYRITGQKIFISGGDHQFAENFIHLTLARIEGAPSGTKGISLFAIPKFRIGQNEILVENDVLTAGDFKKMGQKGYCTTHLVFGEKGDCHGWLVGEPHRGLSYMFQMMNDARISVGISATSMATAAYYASLQYAKERPQGRKLTSSGKKDVHSEQVLIIEHPDVKRMLMLQRVITEGALSLILECSKLNDMVEVSENEEDRKKFNLLLELLTPVAKTYPSEMGQVSISNGLQVLGGYGFTDDFILQQYYRDIRITAIYEGTTGIQSLDLLGRKIVMKDGLALKMLLNKMGQSIASAKNSEKLKDQADALEDSLKTLQNVLDTLLTFAKRGEYEAFLADATIFMELFCTIVIGWQWLKMGIEANQKLVDGQGFKNPPFYEDVLHALRFYYKYEMPKVQSHALTLIHPDQLTVSSSPKASV